MPLLKFSDIPGFREAIKRENDVRDASFLDLTTNIGGVAIRQMTPRDMLILDGIGNPVMSGQLPSQDQLAQFLWILSPEFTLSKLKAWNFGRRIRKLDYLATAKACFKYVEETFQDSPGGSGINSTPYAGWCAHLVNSIAINYGWPEEKILNLPLKRLFQYLKCVRRYNNPDSPTHNPSDKVKGDYIRLLNARAQLVNILKRRTN